MRLPRSQQSRSIRLTCPACRATNEFSHEAESVCRRCKADLRLLLHAETCRLELLASAWLSQAHGEISESHALLSQAEALRQDGESHFLRAWFALTQRNFQEAYQHLLQARKQPQA